MKSLPLAAYWERDAAAQAVRLALPMLEPRAPTPASAKAAFCTWSS